MSISVTQPIPPAYNLTDWNIPTALYTGSQDWLATPKDVAGLIPKINRTGKVFYHRNIDKYNHLDFIWGLDSATLIYHDIVKLALELLAKGA